MELKRSVAWLLSIFIRTSDSMPILCLVDCNSFFVSCERFLNPSLKGKPVIVLSNNDGMVVSRSKEAKALGVNWDAYHLIRETIRTHKIKVFSSNYPLYSEMSGRVMSVLKEFAPIMEVYSCDEAFLDLTGIENLEAYGLLIRKTVMQYTGIPVSIGIARTKTLAKIANRIAKNSPKIKTGVFNLVDSPYLDEALKRIKIKHVWGVGRRWAEKLQSNDIQTAYDLANSDHRWILKQFNVVLTRTALELQGQFCLPLQLVQPISKSIMSSMSFGKLIEDYESLKQVISTYAAGSATKMRSEVLACTTVCVFLETNRFLNEPQYTPWIKVPFPCATDNTAEIIQTALIGLDGIYRNEYRYNKGGVMLEGLIPSTERQTNLFDVLDREESSRLMEVLDTVNKLYGPGTVRYGSQGFKNRSWKTRQNHLSTVTKPGEASKFQSVAKSVELGQNVELYNAL